MTETVEPQVTPDPATTTWVPVWGVGGAPFNYKGDYSAAAAYVSGDVVIYNGIAYLSTKAQAGVAPTAWPLLGGLAPFPGTELDYVQRTTDVSINTTTEATAVTILTSNSITYDGTRVKIECFLPSVWWVSGGPGANYLTGVLLRDTTVLGQFGVKGTDPTSAQTGYSAVKADFFDTPSAGAHTYTIKGFMFTATTYAVKAGAGGSGAFVPAWLRVVKA